MHRTSTGNAEKNYLETLCQQWRSFEGTEKPQSLWIACSDAVLNRPLELTCDQTSTLLLRGPGKTLFTDAIYTAQVMSAIDYAVCCLGIRNLVICGHSMCTCMVPTHFAGEQEVYLAGFKGILQRNRQREQINALAREHLIRGLHALKATISVAHALRRGNLRLWGLFYLAECGLFQMYDDGTRSFQSLDIPGRLD